MKGTNKLLNINSKERNITLVQNIGNRKWRKKMFVEVRIIKKFMKSDQEREGEENTEQKAHDLRAQEA